MRILDVSPRVVSPVRRGSATRTFNLLSYLSERHEVRQLSHAQPGIDRVQGRLEAVWHSPSYCEVSYRHPLARLGEFSERRWVSAPVLSGALLYASSPASLRDLARRWADVVLVEFPWQFEFCRRLGLRGPLVLAAHNVERDKFAEYAVAAGRRGHGSPWLGYIERVEANAVRYADLVVAVSPADRFRMIDYYAADPERVVVVRNGADTRRYAPVDAATRRCLKQELGLPERPAAIFVASDVPPNRAALEWVRRVAGRALDRTFLVIGAVSAPARTEGNVVYTGLVDDLRPYLGAADLAFCPIQFGGGTKIKLLEALAAGLPAIVFDETIIGLELHHEQQVLVAGKSEEELTAAVARLGDDPALCERLGTAGAAFVAGTHDWRESGHQLEAALSSVCSQRRVKLAT